MKLYSKLYKIPNWGKIYLNLVFSNGGDSVDVTILEDGKEIIQIYKTNNYIEAESYVEGFLEQVVRNNKKIPCPDKRNKGWTEVYAV